MNDKLQLAMKTLRSIRNDPSHAEAIIDDVMDRLEAMEEVKYADDKMLLPHSFSARLCFNMGWTHGALNALNGIEETCDAAWESNVSKHLHKESDLHYTFEQAISALSPFALLVKKYRSAYDSVTIDHSTSYDQNASRRMAEETAMEAVYEELVSHDIDVFYRAEEAIHSITQCAQNIHKPSVWQLRVKLSDGSWSGWCLSPEYPTQYGDKHVEIRELGVISHKTIAAKE